MSSSNEQTKLVRRTDKLPPQARQANTFLSFRSLPSINQFVNRWLVCAAPCAGFQPQARHRPLPLPNAKAGAAGPTASAARWVPWHGPPPCGAWSALRRRAGAACAPAASGGTPAGVGSVRGPPGPRRRRAPAAPRLSVPRRRGRRGRCAARRLRRGARAGSPADSRGGQCRRKDRAN